MRKKSNFEKWTAEEMRFCRREFISTILKQSCKNFAFLSYWIRMQEIRFYGFELRQYHIYEYKDK